MRRRLEERQGARLETGVFSRMSNSRMAAGEVSSCPVDDRGPARFVKSFTRNNNVPAAAVEPRRVASEDVAKEEDEDVSATRRRTGGNCGPERPRGVGASASSSLVAGFAPRQQFLANSSCREEEEWRCPWMYEEGWTDKIRAKWRETVWEGQKEKAIDDETRRLREELCVESDSDDELPWQPNLNRWRARGELESLRKEKRRRAEQQREGEEADEKEKEQRRTDRRRELEVLVASLRQQEEEARKTVREKAANDCRPRVVEVKAATALAERVPEATKKTESASTGEVTASAATTDAV